MTARIRIATLPSVLLMAVFACADTSAPPTSAPTEAPLAVEPTRERTSPKPIPTPTLPPTPTELSLQSRIVPGAEPNTRIVDRHIQVWYAPCEPTIIDAVAAIILTDLYSSSRIYLNRGGSVRASPRADYRTEEGRARLWAVLADTPLMELVLIFPECPKPDLEPQPTASAPAAPPIPRASLEYGGRRYQGKRGSYCWPVNASSSVCADAAWWVGFDKQSPVFIERGNGFEVVISDDAPGPEQVRVEVFTVLETGSRPQLGESVHSVDVGEVPVLDLPLGVYFLSIFLKFEPGDVSYVFKIEVVD